jgi:hypothetical protein
LKSIVLVFALLSIAHVISNAQPEQLKVNIGMSGGYTVPIGDFNNHFKSSYSFGLIGFVPVSQNLLLGANFTFNNLNSVANGSIQSFIITPFARFFFFNNPMIFFQFGTGIFLNNADYYFINANSLMYSKWKTNDLGFNVGAGSIIEISRNLNLEISPIWNFRYFNRNINGYFFALNTIFYYHF